jgi:mannose-6-phosphate isomerase-like protein (cupin superfamily)
VLKLLTAINCDEQSGLSYHYHDEQVEAFYVLDGTLHVETSNEEYVIESNQALFVDPRSPQWAFNLESADGPVRVLALLMRLRNMIDRVGREATSHANCGPRHGLPR